MLAVGQTIVRHQPWRFPHSPTPGLADRAKYAGRNRVVA